MEVFEAPKLKTLTIVSNFLFMAASPDLIEPLGGSQYLAKTRKTALVANLLILQLTSWTHICQQKL